MDKLEEIFNNQDILQEHVEMNHLGNPFYKEPEIFKGFRIFMILTAIIHESVELQRETNWKWWKKGKEDLDMKNIKEETADILHFLIQLCLEIGFTPNEILEEYKLKLKENHERIKRGY